MDEIIRSLNKWGLEWLAFKGEKGEKKGKEKKIYRRSQGRLEPELKQDIDSAWEYAVRNEQARALKQYVGSRSRREQRREHLEEKFTKFAEEIGKKRFNMTRMKSFIVFIEREKATEIKGQSATVNRYLSL